MIKMGLIFRRSFNVITLCKRSLFNENFLGVTEFKKKRAVAISSKKHEKLKGKLKEVCEDADQSVFTHQIKQMPYIAETAEDADLFRKAFEKYCRAATPGNVIFQDFRLAPEIMRMYYVLNLPVEGLSLIQDQVTSTFFKDIKSYAVLQDLLYNNEFYGEVCELFHVIQDKQILGRNIPFINYILFQAACYKLNTSNSYDDAMKTFKEFINFRRNPAWPIIMYTMFLALENGAPELPLTYPLGNDSASANIKLAALIKTGDIPKALDYFNKTSNKSTYIQSVASDLYSNLEKLKNKGPPDEKILNFIDQMDINSFKIKTFEELAAETMNSIEKLS